MVTHILRERGLQDPHNMRRERIVEPREGMFLFRVATFLCGISCILRGCVEDPLEK